jgi:hypothetical protein
VQQLFVDEKYKIFNDGCLVTTEYVDDFVDVVFGQFHELEKRNETIGTIIRLIEQYILDVAEYDDYTTRVNERIQGVDEQYKKW